MENCLNEIQHFGFSATQVTLERKKLFENLVLDALQSVIKKATKSKKVAQLLSQEKKNIFQGIFTTWKQDFEELKALDQKYFKIPVHVLLPGDFDHAKNNTNKIEDLDEKIAELKQKYLENVVISAYLEVEEEKIQSLTRYFEKYSETRAVLKHGLSQIKFSEANGVSTLLLANKFIVDKLQNIEDDDN